MTRQTSLFLLGTLAATMHGCSGDLQCSEGQVEIHGVCECPAGTAYERPDGCVAVDAPAHDGGAAVPEEGMVAKDAGAVASPEVAGAPVDASTPPPAPADAGVGSPSDAAASAPDATAGKSVTVRIEPSADSYVNASGTNFGPEGSLFVDPQDGPQRVFLRFDLRAVPATATVARATLQMTAYEGFAYGGDGNCYVHAVTNDRWLESEISGQNQPTAEPDALGYWWLWYDATAKDQEGSLSGEPLRVAVEQEVRGDRALSLRIHSPGYRTHYRSREYAKAAQRPSLTVDYVVP